MHVAAGLIVITQMDDHTLVGFRGVVRHSFVMKVCVFDLNAVSLIATEMPQALVNG